VTHCAFPALNEDHGHRRAGKAFSDGIRDHDINCQVLLLGKKTLKEALMQTPELDIVKLGVWSSTRLQKTSDRVSRRSQPPPKIKNRLLTVYVPVL
jgi:hypothetical protein